MAEDLREIYRAKLATGALEPDTAQAALLERLAQLCDRLSATRAANAGWWRRLIAPRHPGGADAGAVEAPRGLYIHGGVGRGKSMAMDLFFAAAPVVAKRRVHFHAFMLETHEAMHRWRQSQEGDPIPPLADRVAAASQLLCFDEFQVTNIADAMLLGRLFEALWARDVIIVATSNWPPDDLYKDGLQRDRFLPFIAALKARLGTVELAGPTDYRLMRMRGRPIFFHPLGAASRAQLERDFALLTDDALAQPMVLTHQGRRLEMNRVAKGVGFADFDELCARARGAADYLALANSLHCLIIDGVPAFDEATQNEARRFMILVDAFYEKRALLILAAAVPLDRLGGEGRHAFEFRRTVSRLHEMESAGYFSDRLSTLP